MRWVLLAVTGAVLSACTAVPSAPSRILTNGNVLISTGGADDAPGIAGGSASGTGSAAGSGGSGTGGTSTQTPSGSSGNNTGTGTGSSGSGSSGGAVIPGPNGSSLVPTTGIEARRVQGKEYIPLTTFGDFGADELYLVWARGTFFQVPGSRPFTPNEGAMLEMAINQLNNAIGRSVFSYGGTTSGDIPVTTQDVADGSILGFAQFVPQVVTADRSYVDTKVVMNVGNLSKFAPDPTNYQDLFKTVILHELGHVAGLGHNTQDGTLMNASTETTPIVVGFSQSEIDTLRLVYGQ